jgi:hypothetical protein
MNSVCTTRSAGLRNSSSNDIYSCDRFPSEMPQMRPMRDIRASELEWVQPRAMERYFVLRSDQDVLATLRWRNMFGSLAEASTAEGIFTLKRGGFLQPYVTIRQAGTEDDIAVLKISLFRHGTLEFRIGKVVSLVSTRFFGFEWEFIDENRQKLCSMRMRNALMKRYGEVAVSSTVRRDRDLLVMLVIGWYAMVLMSNESSAAASSNAAMVGAAAAASVPPPH